jgi:hypothetical protein
VEVFALPEAEMSRENLIPNVFVTAGVAGLLLTVWMLGMWILDLGDGKHAPAETVFTGCLCLMSGTWALGVSAVLRPFAERWQRVLYRSLYAGTMLLMVCGLVVLYQSTRGAAESGDSARWVVAFFVTLGVISLGVGALVQRASRVYSMSGSS